MRVVDPEWLILLALLPVLAYALKHLRRDRALAYSSVTGLAHLSRNSVRVRWHRWLPWLRVAAILCCVLALARPQWGIQATKIDREGIAISMVVDISSSMGAEDLMIDETLKNRLSVVKDTFKSFVMGDETALGGRDGDLISLISFARFSDIRSPGTLDHDALVALLDDIEMVSLPEEDGTAIGDGMVLAIDGLRELAGSSRVMILLTDGSNNAGETSPMQAASVAKALGIKVYAIGAGTRGMAMMPAKKRGGGTELRPTMVFIDDEGLTEIAEFTGGKYFRATDGKALSEIYREIDRLEKGRNVSTSYQEYVEIFMPFAMLAIVLLLLEALLANTWLRTAP